MPDDAAYEVCALARAVIEAGSTPTASDVKDVRASLAKSDAKRASKIVKLLKAAEKKRARTRAFKKAEAWCQSNGAWLTELERAQAAYFVISSTANAVARDLSDRSDSMAIEDYCAQAAANREKFARDLTAGEWPDDAQDEIDALAAALAAEAGIYYQCSHDPSSVQEQILDDATVAFGAAASAVRLAL